jgi:enamine deaminase RidA (YjgF/YER057c/UK114 family)
VSGQLPIAADSTKPTDASFEDQAQQAIADARAGRQACGARTQDLVHVRVYVTDSAHWPEFDVIYAQWIGDHDLRALSCQCRRYTTT